MAGNRPKFQNIAWELPFTGVPTLVDEVFEPLE